MSAIDEILWLLKDGEWHDLKEITEKVSLPKFKAEIAISFLGEYDFIQLNENVKSVRLQRSILEFIEEIQRIEKEEALSH
jgi:hypothetical protein